MNILIYDQAETFLKEYFKNKTLPFEPKHPWRSTSDYIVLHSLRVFSLAMEISEAEKNKLTDDEVTLIGLSAILHDIGKIERKYGHALISAEIVCRWLDENPNISSKISDKERLLSIIRKHSDKNDIEKDLCSAILKDADILDEIGAISIFMASNHLDKYNPYFFNELQERLNTVELNFCKTEINKLNTKYAKRILERKMDFIKNFIEQLNFELKGTKEIFTEIQDTKN